MSTFKVCVQRYVEEIASVTIDAETAEDAVKAARQMLSDGNVDNWEAGDDVVNDDVYAVLDQAGDPVWER